MPVSQTGQIGRFYRVAAPFTDAPADTPASEGVLLAYAWPILNPALSGSIVTTCTVVSLLLWAAFARSTI